MVINKHTQFAGPGRTNSNVVGYPMMPVYMSKMGGFLFITFGVIVLIASLFTINPIWNYGPYDPSPVSAGTQPDWYIGFADGALRLVPPRLGVRLPRTARWSFNILDPARRCSACSSSLVAIYPFIEAWVTGDKREHHIAQRPRNAATRTAIGAAGVTFYAVLWAAAASDIIATHFWLTMEGVIHTLQALLFIGPIIAYFVTKRICIALQKKDREIALHGYESGRIVRLPGGEYIEVHQPVDEYERWKLVDIEHYEPLIVRPNAKGRIPWHENLRAWHRRAGSSRTACAPVTQAELDAARRAPAPRARPHRDRGGPRDPGRPRARRRSGRSARPDRRRSQLRDGRPPLERDRRRRRRRRSREPQEGARPVDRASAGRPGTASVRSRCRGVPPCAAHRQESVRGVTLRARSAPVRRSVEHDRRALVLLRQARSRDGRLRRVRRPEGRRAVRPRRRAQRRGLGAGPHRRRHPHAAAARSPSGRRAELDPRRAGRRLLLEPRLQRRRRRRAIEFAKLGYAVKEMIGGYEYWVREGQPDRERRGPTPPRRSTPR